MVLSVHSVGHEIELLDFGAALHSAEEQSTKSLFLRIELLEHQLHGSAVGWHLVSLAGGVVGAAFAYLVDLLGGNLGTLGY